MTTYQPEPGRVLAPLPDLRLARFELVPGVEMDDVETYRFAEALVTQAEYARAVALLEPLAARVTDKCVRELLGRAYFGRAQLGPAERIFRDLVEQFPDDPYARDALARTLRRQSRHAEAAVHHRVSGAFTGS